MDINAEKAMTHYAEAYRKLYNRTPKELRAVDHDWVIVNGARMRAAELEYLTMQLQREYDQDVLRRKGIVMRLLSWFKQ